MATIETAALAAYVAVVRTGSFTRAAEQLGTQKAHLSRVVTRLEQRLGAVLLQRSTRSLAMTEVGREIYERARMILAALDETVRAVQETQTAPRGILRITCGVEFGVLAVNDWIARYLRQYPDVRVEATFTNHVVDLIHEGYDVAIRVGILEDSGLVGRKLGEVTYGLYASRAYLRRRKAPRTLADLASHELILSTQTMQHRRWTFVDVTGQTETIAHAPRYLANTHMAVRDAAIAGVGIALVPDFQVRASVANGDLRRVLPAWSRVPVPVHAVYPSTRYLTPKVRAFVDCAAEQFKALSVR